MEYLDNAVIKLVFSRVILVKILQILRLTFSWSHLYTPAHCTARPAGGGPDTALGGGGGGGAINKQTLGLSGYMKTQVEGGGEGVGGDLTAQD